MRSAAVFVILISISVAACRKRPEKPEETATKGSLMILATQSYEDFIRQEANAYVRSYTDVSISVGGTSTREAIVHLLNDSVQCICVDRPLNDEERQVAAKAELIVAENKIGEGALALIVHESNPMEFIGFQDIKDILTGSKKSWTALKESRWAGDMNLVLTGRNSGTYEILLNHFFKIQSPLTVTTTLETEKEVVEYTRTHPQALGIVSIAAVRNVAGKTKVLAVESANVMDELFVRPTQLNIYRALYPLHYSLYLYTSGSSRGVGGGFSTFVRSMQGQKIVQDAGFVPVAIPNRIIQINSE